jgi:hypothetical protein
MSEPVLPASCAACVYFPPSPAPGGLCRRHAPAPGQDAFEVARWPRTRPADRCGSGAAVTDGTGPSVVVCRSCVHWLQPKPVRPDYRQGLGAVWWAMSGNCTRLAPSPSAEEGRHTFWKVTHATDRCGDGVAI